MVETGGGEAIAIRPLGCSRNPSNHRAIDGAYSPVLPRRLREILEATDWEAALGSHARGGRG